MRTSWLALVAACGRIGFNAGTPPPDAAVIRLPSCQTLPPICGPTASSDCCASSVVDGGAFLRSYDVAVDNVYKDGAHPATVSSFRLDNYLITVGRFRAFVAAGMGTRQQPPAADAGAHAKIPGSGWDPSFTKELAVDTPQLLAVIGGACNNGVIHTWTDAPGDNENRPINCLTWYEAFAFCIWDGGYLPTDAEWNYAAAGGNEQRAFPWSSSLVVDDSSQASYWVDPTKQCYGDRMNGCAISDLTPVGSKPAVDGRWGHSDLGGQLFEWLLDSASIGTGFVSPCDDCANLFPFDQRYARGGSYRDDAMAMRVGTRDSFGAYIAADVWGARCARPL